MSNAKLRAVPCSSDQQGSLAALVGPRTDSPPAQAAAQQSLPRHARMQGRQWRVLYSPSWEVRSSAAAIPHKVNSLLSGPELKDSRADGFAHESRSWEGAELIPQLSGEGSPTGPDRQPFLRPCTGEAQEVPGQCQGMILPSLRLFATWNILASKSSPLQLHQHGMVSRAIRQCVQQQQSCRQLSHRKQADLHQLQCYHQRTKQCMNNASSDIIHKAMHEQVQSRYQFVFTALCLNSVWCFLKRNEKKQL